MANPAVVTVSLAAASANNIALSQAGTGGTALSINGAAASNGVATLDAQRRVLITSAGNDSGITFKITGTNKSGSVISEVVTGGNIAAVQSVLDYLTVTSVVPSGNTAAAVTVGTSGVGSSPWIAVNYHLDPVNIGLAVVVSGTVNYTVEYTYDDIQGSTPPTAWPLTALATKTASTDAGNASITWPVRAWRLTVNSSTAPASATATGIQGGITN